MRLISQLVYLTVVFAILDNYVLPHRFQWSTEYWKLNGLAVLLGFALELHWLICHLGDLEGYARDLREGGEHHH